MTHPLSSAEVTILSSEISNFVKKKYQKISKNTDIDRILIHNV